MAKIPWLNAKDLKKKNIDKSSCAFLNSLKNISQSTASIGKSPNPFRRGKTHLPLMPTFYMSMICQLVVVVDFVYFYELACLKLNAQILEQLQVYL
tara:strand:- start:109 stop:396 length:288 start_codon:yes stop_codon:yes gene_type:complete